MRRRKKSPQTLLGIILCIPIAFIAYFAISYSSHNISPESVSSINLTLPSGEQFAYSDSEQIDFFVNAQLDSKSITTPVRDVTNESPVIIQYDRGDKLVDYKLYPQLNVSGCMLVDSEGSLYLMTSDAAEELLIRPELQYLYSDSLLPALSVVSNNGASQVLPANYTWHYKKIDGNYYPDTMTGVYDETAQSITSVYPNSNSTLKFSVEPTTKDYNYVTEQGTKIDISDISYLSFNTDTKIFVELTAKWSELGGPNFYGEAKYTFPLLYDIPAVVSLEQKVFDPGDIAIFNIQYLNENEKIAVSSQLETSGLVCYTEGESTFALLPISCNNIAGEYTINFEVGGATYSDAITLNEKVYERSLLSVSKEEYNEMLSDEVIAQASEKLSAVFSKVSQEAFYTFGGVFKAPLSGNVLAEYGKEVIVSEDATVRKVIGTIYKVSDGTTVKAAQRGKVVFSESLAATGNTVVIDHGFGIMTCYFNLKSFDCAVGDVVQQGEIIAYSGSTGYTNGQSILDYAVAVNGIYVNPKIFNTEMSLY